MSVRFYTIYKDTSLVDHTATDELRAYMIKLQKQRDADLLQKLIYEDIPTFPMNTDKFHKIKHKFIKISTYEDRLCMLFIYPDKVIGISHGKESNFNNMEDAYSHYCNIVNKKINVFEYPVKVY